jgi:hypothetical protein
LYQADRLRRDTHQAAAAGQNSSALAVAQTDDTCNAQPVTRNTRAEITAQVVRKVIETLADSHPPDVPIVVRHPSVPLAHSGGAQRDGDGPVLLRPAGLGAGLARDQDQKQWRLRLGTKWESRALTAAHSSSFMLTGARA